MLCFCNTNTCLYVAYSDDTTGGIRASCAFALFSPLPPVFLLLCHMCGYPSSGLAGMVWLHFPVEPRMREHVTSSFGDDVAAGKPFQPPHSVSPCITEEDDVVAGCAQRQFCGDRFCDAREHL